jgi:hypothetical protein
VDSTSGLIKGHFICHTLTGSPLLIILILLGGNDLPQWPCGQAWVCGRSFAGTASSQPAGSIDVCLLRLLRIVR